MNSDRFYNYTVYLNGGWEEEKHLCHLKPFLELPIYEDNNPTQMETAVLADSVIAAC
jgi:hypothetical protein